MIRSATTRLAFALVLAAGVTAAVPARAQCLGDTETATSLARLTTSNDAALASAIAHIDRHRGLTTLSITPRAREVPAQPVSGDAAFQQLLGTPRPTTARVVRRVDATTGPQIVLVASPYTYNPCSQPDLAPDAYVFVRTRAGRVIPVHVVYEDTAVRVASCQCVGGCGAAMPPRSIAREYVLPVGALREVGRMETVRVARRVAQRPVCSGMP